MNNVEQKHAFLKGLFFYIVSFLFFSFMGALSKPISECVPTTVILFSQNFIGFIFVAFTLPFCGSISLHTQRLKMHLFRAVIGALGMFFLFYSIRLISLTNAVLLVYSAPIFMPIISFVLFKQKASIKTWLSIFIGFFGIILVLQPSTKIFHMGSVTALCGGICLAFVLFAIKWLRSTEPILRILFYYFFFSTVVFLPFALLQWQPMTLQAAMYLLGIGASLILSQLFIIIAYRYTSATALSPFVYSVVVFTSIIDWLFWNETPTPLTLCGMLFVVIGGIMTTIWSSTNNSTGKMVASN